VTPQPVSDAALNPRLQEIADDFNAMPDRDRLQLLLEFSRELPALPDRYAEHRDLLEAVPECQTPLFLAVEVEPDSTVHLFFDAPPEAPTTRGFAAILHAGLDGLPADEVLATPTEFTGQLGLQDLVSPLRLRGMAAMLARIKRQIRDQRSAPQALVRHLRDALRHRARCAQRHVRAVEPPGHDRPAVAHAVVVRVRLLAPAAAVAPLPGHRRAPGLDRGADRRLDLVQRLVGDVRYPPCPLVHRVRGGPPGRAELLPRVVLVTAHDPMISPESGCGQRTAATGPSGPLPGRTRWTGAARANALTRPR
jgi:cysteine desulfuration protein SufE